MRTSKKPIYDLLSDLHAINVLNVNLNFSSSFRRYRCVARSVCVWMYCRLRFLFVCTLNIRCSGGLSTCKSIDRVCAVCYTVQMQNTECEMVLSLHCKDAAAVAAKENLPNFELLLTICTHAQSGRTSSNLLESGIWIQYFRNIWCKRANENQHVPHILGT